MTDNCVHLLGYFSRYIYLLERVELVKNDRTIFNCFLLTHNAVNITAPVGVPNQSSC